jgi:hypothetical protein
MHCDSFTTLSAMLSHTPPQRREAEEGKEMGKGEEENTIGKERARCRCWGGKETRPKESATAGMARWTSGAAGDAVLLFFQHVGDDDPQQW